MNANQLSNAKQAVAGIQILNLDPYQNWLQMLEFTYIYAD